MTALTAVYTVGEAIQIAQENLPNKMAEKAVSKELQHLTNRLDKQLSDLV